MLPARIRNKKMLIPNAGYVGIEDRKTPIKRAMQINIFITLNLTQKLTFVNPNLKEVI